MRLKGLQLSLLKEDHFELTQLIDLFLVFKTCSIRLFLESVKSTTSFRTNGDIKTDVQDKNNH